MELQECLILCQSMIRTRAKHKWYDHVKNLARDYKAYLTGKDMEYMLRRFDRREDEDMFIQRVRLTIPITSAVAASIMAPFTKVARTEKIRKKIDTNKPEKDTIINTMLDKFYGNQRTQDKGLDYYMRTRFLSLSFSDPNAWVVIEWDATNAASVIAPRPYEVSACDAWNYLVENEEIEWLWCHNDIYFTAIANKDGKIYYEMAEKPKESEILADDNILIQHIGDKYTIYDKDQTIVFTQCDPYYLTKTGYVLSNDESIWQDTSNAKYFLVKIAYPKLDFVPAIRVGYITDLETDDSTFVNPFHKAKPYFDKSIKTVSELDLTMTLHTFPQKMQYVQPCQGLGKSAAKRCNNGYLGDGNKCPSCKGTGVNVHTTAQDVLYIPMPESVEDMLPLDNMIAYKTPPIDLLTFQKGYIDSLNESAHQSVFNTQQLLKKSAKGTDSSGDPGGGNPIAQTATEISTNYQGIFDAVYPYTQKVSSVYKEIVYISGTVAAVDMNTAKIVYDFPADFKLKTVTDLLNDLTLVNTANAPSFMRDAINNDMAEIVYDPDEIDYKKYLVKHKFFPYNGKSNDEIALLQASSYVTDYDKILYANFDTIFNDIELENPAFWGFAYSDQEPLVDKKVLQIQADIASKQALTLTIPNDFGANDEMLDATQTNTNGNPGPDAGEDDTNADGQESGNNEYEPAVQKVLAPNPNS